MKTSLKIAAPIFLAIVCFCAVSALGAEERPKLEDATPTNGVFYTYTGYMTTVLELKDGHVRYWFESDEKSKPEPNYPLTGLYSITTNTITLKHDQVFQKQWTFRKVNGFITLWRPDAMNLKPDARFDVKQLKRYGAGSILTLTDKPPEDVWQHRQAPSQ